MTAWTRSRTPSFCRILATWVLAVASLTTSSRQISGLDRPRMSRSSTSRSRGVSSPTAGGTAGWARTGILVNSSMTARVTAGASSASPLATMRTAAAISSGGASLSMNPLAPARSAS
jgi:hypothetical protein